MIYMVWVEGGDESEDLGLSIVILLFKIYFFICIDFNTIDQSIFIEVSHYVKCTMEFDPGNFNFCYQLEALTHNLQ